MKKVLILSTLFLVFLSCHGQKSVATKLNKTIKTSSENHCEEKGGYWYNNKCWANFKEFDEGISVKDIDAETEKQLNAAKEFGLQIDGKSFDIDFFFPEQDEESLLMILVFSEQAVTKTLLLTTTIKESKRESFTVEVVLFNANLIALSENEESNITSMIAAQGSATVQSKEQNKLQEFDISGTLQSATDQTIIPFKTTVGEALAGIGDTTLDIKGNEVYLNGTLGTNAYVQFKDLIENHPEVTTIVLENVPGSINDAVNMHTGRIIREAGLNTKVLADSEIASGGVDLFCAGKQRIVTSGARLGIHSWGGDGISAGELAKDHPAHQHQIEYFTMCLGTQKGPAFYFRTLEAAPASEIHWMDDTEIKETIATQVLEKK